MVETDRRAARAPFVLSKAGDGQLRVQARLLVHLHAIWSSIDRLNDDREEEIIYIEAPLS